MKLYMTRKDQGQGEFGNGIEVWSYQTDCLDQRMSTAAMDKVVCKSMYIGLIKKLANCPN